MKPCLGSVQEQPTTFRRPLIGAFYQSQQYVLFVVYTGKLHVFKKEIKCKTKHYQKYSGHK